MITIRRFSPEDQSPVCTLIVNIMNEEYHDAKTAYPTQDIEDVQKFYGGLGEAFFVAVKDNHVVGTVAIKKEDDRVALLRRLFVSASFRNQQIGQKLIKHAIHFCDEVGYKEVIFKTTSKMVGANKICQKQGFIQRAHLDLGGLELLKFSLSLRNGRKHAS